jgi:hypothetical protein
VYDVISQWFMEPLSAGIVDRFVNMPANQVAEFLEFYDSLVGAGGVTPLKPAETRPYLPIGDGIDTEVDARLVPVGLGAVRAVLVYAHRAVVPCLLRSALRHQLDLNVYREPWIGAPEDPALVTRHALNTLLALKPLADAGIVECVEHRGVAELSPADLATITAATRGLSLDELDTRLLDPWSGLAQRASKPAELLGRKALASLLDSMRSIEAHPDAFQLMLKYPVITGMFSRTLASPSHLLPTGKRAVLERLLLEGPPNVVPSFKDIIAIRHTSGAFAAWRDALTQAIDHLDELDEGDESWVDHAREIVGDHLTAARSSVEREVKRSTLLGQTKEAGVTLGISALGVGAASAVGASLLTGLIAGTTVATATTLKNYLTKLRGRREQKALLAHHLSFEPTTKSH